MNKRFTSSLAILTIIFIAIFSFKTAYSADKPSVETIKAQTNDTRGVLKGVIKESGGRKISSYGFKWGTSRNLSQNQIFNAADKNITDFTATINNLKAGNTYYYQAFAVNSKGPAYGEIKSFSIPVKYNQAPKISVTDPSGQLKISAGMVVNMAANAVDDQKVEAMGLYINDELKAKSGNDSIKYDWDTSKLSSGEYKVLFTAWDGNQASRKELTLGVEGSALSDNESNSAESPNSFQPAQQSISNLPSRSGSSVDYSRYPLVSKMNGIYGQFHYRNTSGGRIEVDPNWVAENIVTITLPGLNQSVQVHRKAAANFIQAFTYIKNGTTVIDGRQVPLLSLINTMDGTYVTRHVMWDPSRGLSNHSWGTAIDINADDHLRYVNPSSEPYDPNVILWEKAFKPAGFSWGNSYSDSMHYELLN